MTSKLFLSLCLSAALVGCGAPAQNETRGQGGTEMMGPDSEGRFYVVGLAGDVLPHETVNVTNVEGETVSVTADADGSWAVMTWSPVDRTVDVSSSERVVATAAMAPQKVNVNFASRRGLETLPGIGAELAQRIINHRGIYGLFENVADLEAVDGIGPVSLQSVVPYVETKIDVNSASKAQLMVLPGVGASKAAAIVAWREANGSFESLSDLLLVDGMTTTLFASIQPFVRAGEVSHHPGATLVNVNRASIDELLTLPGIGEGKAKAIADYRVNHGVFHSKEEVVFVPGIGGSTMAAIRDLITVGVLDAKVGTFVAGGAWQYTDAQGATVGESFPKSLLVKFERSLSDNELLVTFVGGGYCGQPEDCAPFTLKGTIVSDSSNGDFSYRLSGMMPAEDGSFFVTANAQNEGRVTETEILASLVATRGSETYKLSLTGYRSIQ